MQTDRDRLIELFETIEKDPAITCPHYKTDKTCDTCKYTINNAMCNHLERKVDYLLANGVIVPPCKVGDKVYTYGAKRIKEWEITFVGKNSRNEYKFIAVVGKCEDLLTFWNYEIGKTVFLTKEEAEKKLKELK